jgi:hypothetical protein
VVQARAGSARAITQYRGMYSYLPRVINQSESEILNSRGENVFMQISYVFRMRQNVNLLKWPTFDILNILLRRCEASYSLGFHYNFSCFSFSASD